MLLKIAHKRPTQTLTIMKVLHLIHKETEIGFEKNALHYNAI